MEKRQASTPGPREAQQADSSTRRDKRRACFYWQKTGLCRYGSSCRFAHDEELAYKPPDYTHRQWSHAQASTSGAGDNGSGPRKHWDVTVMSYNVLADELALTHAKELYRAVPEWCLQWPERVTKLLDEILHWKPDVIALQEIDHPEDFTRPLHEKGYDCSYACRTGGRSDGCLTLWRRDKFEIIAWDQIQMSKHSLKDNVGLVTVLRTRQGEQEGGGDERKPPAFAVANTHLLFNPRRGDIKLGQAGLILRRMADLCRSLSIQPLAIFTGDFNSTPQSGIYSFIRHGELDCSQEDRRTLSGQLVSGEGGWPLEPLGAVGERRKAAPMENQVPALRACIDLQQVQQVPGAAQIQHVKSMATLDLVSHLPGGPSTLPHSSSFPRAVDAARGGLDGVQGPMPATDSKPMYPYTDQFGQVAWSHIPPSEGAIRRQPFYHEPMRVEEVKPPPSPGLVGVARSGSFAQRQANAGTWTLEQLLTATGKPGNGREGSKAKPPPPAVSLDPWRAAHPLPMRSTYEAVLGMEPAYTSCHGKFIGTVDYVWFTPQAGELTLTPHSVLLPPPLESLHCGLPSPEWPSDHISLLARFVIAMEAGGTSA